MSSAPSTIAGSSSDNLRGSLWMVVAMAGFAFNDALVKFATHEISPAQVMAVRGVMASALLFAIASLRGLIRSPSAVSGPVLWRTIADVGATIAYITALTQLPLANASAIFQALPLTVTIAAVLFLGERPGWRRWSAIAVGFVGVLIIVRPGTEGFSVYSLAVIVSVFFSAARDIFTRKVARTTPSIFVSLIGAMAVTVFGAVLLAFEGWNPMSPSTLLALAVASCSISIGYVAIVSAMRAGEIGFIAPFRYSILLFAFLLGIVVFAESPSAYDLVGSAIVVARGIYLIYRERRLGRVKLVKTQAH